MCLQELVFKVKITHFKSVLISAHRYHEGRYHRQATQIPMINLLLGKMECLKL